MSRQPVFAIQIARLHFLCVFANVAEFYYNYVQGAWTNGQSVGGIVVSNVKDLRFEFHQ